MAVVEIKEYIDNAIQESEQVGMSGYDSALYLKNRMRTVKDMLDELEPKKAHYIEIDNRIDETEPLEYRCSKCRKTFYFEDVDKYCCKCGARMTNAKEILGE